MNILIKLMSIVSLVIAPTLSGMFQDNIQHHRKEKIKTMMAACVEAGCTAEECEAVMPSAIESSSCSGTENGECSCEDNCTCEHCEHNADNATNAIEDPQATNPDN